LRCIKALTRGLPSLRDAGPVVRGGAFQCPYLDATSRHGNARNLKNGATSFRPDPF
jgi:hypothetical protein